MNTNKELDQIVHDWLEDRAAEPSRASLEQALERVATTPQHRRRWLGRWFGLGRGSGATRSAGDRGHPSDTDNGRNRLMFGITTVAASAAALVLAATLVIPRAGPVSEPIPGAGSGVTHVVAADGSGDFATISEAVAAAAEGDTVLVKPGEYREVVVIDKDITLQGDGPRDGVAIVPPTPAPVDADGNGLPTFTVMDSNATVRSVTIKPPPGWGAVLVSGGAPTFEDVALVMTGVPDAMGSFYFAEGTTAVVRDSSFDGTWIVDVASPTIEGNVATADARILGGGHTVVQGNTFSGCCLIVAGPSDVEGTPFATIERNTFSQVPGGDATQPAIDIRDSGTTAQVVGNTVTGMGTGISVRSGAEATIGDNTLVDDNLGIAWSSSAPGSIEGNSITGGVTALIVTGGSPTVSDNTIEGASTRGISIGKLATPTLSGNTVCGSETNLHLADGAAPVMGEGNDICADGNGVTHVVAADGSGDFATISEAVAAAAEGDTVLVKPGEYREVVVIDKDITLQGEGPREGVVIAFPAGAGPNEKDPDGNPFYATLALKGVDATVRGLTVSGAAPTGEQVSVDLVVEGGAPLLEDLSLVTEAPVLDELSIILAAGTAAVIRDSAWRGYLFTDGGASPTLEGNTISSLSATLGLNGPAEATIRGNTFLEGASITASGGLTGLIEGNDLAGGDIGVDSGSDMIVRGNTIHTAATLGTPAVKVADSGTKAQVSGNTVTGMGAGVSVSAGAEATVEGNVLTDNDIGVSWSSTTPGTIEGNTISGGVTGILVTGGSPSIVDNTIEGAASRGISLGSLAAPILSGNTVCGSPANLHVSQNASPQIGENEICPDAPAE